LRRCGAPFGSASRHVACDIWNGLPRGTDGFVQKTFWWSADFDVNKVTQPAITVTGQRLDGPGRLVTPAPGTNASADFGSSMLALVDIPQPAAGGFHSSD
jgi:hypothetical protein